MKKIITTSLLATALLAFSLSGCSAPTQDNAKDSSSSQSTMKKDSNDKESMKKDKMEHSDDTMKKDATDKGMMKKTGYIDYKTYMENPKLYKDGKTVLFFNAKWCPSCQAVDSEFKQDKNAVPEGYTVVSVDYDTATQLRKKYGITMQHTFVQLDKNGNAVNKWSGGSAADLAQRLKG